MSTMKMYRYSEAFKQQVVKEIEEGTLRIAEAARMYDISVAGIYKWLHNLGKDHLIGKVVYVKKRNELDKIREIRVREEAVGGGISEVAFICILPGVDD
ncbi:MAG: transposase [Candidatus Marinimicrobia bacterium]|nr:transposase [Candidatus Neomarinimicrobiota bacterium]